MRRAATLVFIALVLDFFAPNVVAFVGTLRYSGLHAGAANQVARMAPVFRIFGLVGTATAVLLALTSYKLARAVPRPWGFAQWAAAFANAAAHLYLSVMIQLGRRDMTIARIAPVLFAVFMAGALVALLPVRRGSRFISWACALSLGSSVLRIAFLSLPEHSIAIEYALYTIGFKSMMIVIYAASIVPWLLLAASLLVVRAREARVPAV